MIGRQASEAVPIDPCWNVIGVRGDHSCPRLAEYIRCLNCPVYANAATLLLDRYSLHRDPAEQAYPALPEVVPSRSLTVFRIGEEWLALATPCLIEVTPVQAVHSLPHQRSRSLLGVTNVRGTLVPCVALHELLAIAPQATAAMPGSGEAALPRMLILAAQGGPVVVPVDHVDGVRRYEERTIAAGASDQGSHFTAAVIEEGGRRLRVLDEQVLMVAIGRSLT